MPVVEIKANNGEAIENKLIRGKIEGRKTDENGTGLEGAVIGLFRDCLLYTSAYKMRLEAMKRQGQRNDLTCATPLHKSGTVSYTHLDVYKRQAVSRH